MLGLLVLWGFTWVVEGSELTPPTPNPSQWELGPQEIYGGFGSFDPIVGFSQVLFDTVPVKKAPGQIDVIGVLGHVRYLFGQQEVLDRPTWPEPAEA